MKFLGLAAVAVSSLGLGAYVSPRALSLDQWIASQTPVSVAALNEAVSPADGMPGSMIASPSRSAPNYYYHWVRDSALANLTIFHLYQNSSGSGRDRWKTKLFDFASFSAFIQTTVTDLGEPKFELNGAPYAGGWCRPQNDGPALRAITLMQFAQSLISAGESDVAEKILRPVINKDLDFVKGAWNRSGCDLWEEVEGEHFYTMMAQRKALLDAIPLAKFLGQDTAALGSVAQQLSDAILRHWDESKGYFLSTTNRSGGLAYKESNLDASIILGVIHGHTDDGFLPYTDPHVLATAEALQKAFATRYAINQIPGVPGVAIGRYPEDMYAGTNFDGGNPWVLLTAALSRYYYLAANEAREMGDSKNAHAYLTQAEDLLLRLKYHAPADGIWAEQMDRSTGFMTSAIDLTWSHTEVLEAFAARERTLMFGAF